MDILALYISVAIVILTCLVSFRFTRKSEGHRKLPLGSFGWPFMGETMEFLYGKPEKFVGDRMRKYSPDIFKTKILGEKIAVICGPNGHKFLFSNDAKYFTSYRPFSMQNLFKSYQTTPNPKPPTQTGFLKPEALVRYLGDMDTISAHLLHTHWAGKDEVKVYPLAKTVTLTLACRFFLGSDNQDRIARLVNHFDDITMGLHSIVLNVPGTIFYRANKAAAVIRKELLSVIREKKEAMGTGPPTPDLLSYMIIMTDPSGNHMPEIEIADKLMGLIVAGYSTVATAITFLIKYVGLNPHVYNKLQTEQMEVAAGKKAGELLQWEDMQKMKYSWNVICETMRFNPPLQGTFREVLTEFTYAGYTVPKGWKVYWTVSTTNMNSGYFKNPEMFNPSRYDEGEAIPPYTFVPFGGGSRMCPGKEYARLAILAFVHNAVKNYKWEVMFPNEKVIGDMMPTPEKGLPIRLHHI